MSGPVKNKSSGKSDPGRGERNEAAEGSGRQLDDARRHLVAAAVFLLASGNGGLSDGQRRKVLDFADGRDRAPSPHDQENGKGIFSRKED